MEFDNAGLVRLGAVLSRLIRQAHEQAEPAQVAFGRFNAGKGLNVNRRLKVSDKLGTFTITYSRGTIVSVKTARSTQGDKWKTLSVTG